MYATFLDFRWLRASAGGFDSLPYTKPRILFSASATKKNSGLAECNPSMSAFVAVTSHEAYLSAIATTWSRSLMLNFLTLVLTAFPLWAVVILPQRPCSGRLGTVAVAFRSLGENTQRFSWVLFALLLYPLSRCGSVLRSLHRLLELDSRLT